MKGQSRQAGANAFTLIELAVIVLTIGLMVGLIIPGLAKVKRDSLRNGCRNNLKLVGLAFKTWPQDSMDSYPMQRPKEAGGTRELIDSARVFVHFRVLSNELSTPQVLVCPADKEKVAATNFTSGFTDQNVSYFLGVDSSEGWPQSFLSGNRNLESCGQPLAEGLFPLTTNTPLGWTKAIHNTCGNTCLSDGSVLDLSSSALDLAAKNQGLATNRLVIP